MFNNCTYFIVIDLRDKYTVVVILDQDGQVVELNAPANKIVGAVGATKEAR